MEYGAVRLVAAGNTGSRSQTNMFEIVKEVAHITNLFRSAFGQQNTSEQTGELCSDGIGIFKNLTGYAMMGANSIHFAELICLPQKAYCVRQHAACSQWLSHTQHA